MTNDDFDVVAEANRIREVAVEAPRGRILDRNGTVIVGNRISIQVSVDRSVLRDLEEAERTEVLTQLAVALSRHSINTTVEDLEARIADQRFSPYVPVPVAGRVPEALKIWRSEEPTSELQSL